MYHLQEDQIDLVLEEQDKFWGEVCGNTLSLDGWPSESSWNLEEAVCPPSQPSLMDMAEPNPIMTGIILDKPAQEAVYSDHCNSTDRRHSVCTFPLSQFYSPQSEADQNLWEFFDGSFNFPPMSQATGQDMFNPSEGMACLSLHPSANGSFAQYAPVNGIDLGGPVNVHAGRRHSMASAPSSLFICPWGGCGKSFNRFYNLRSHYRTHTLEKPFSCPKCHQCFARNHDLKRHARTHSESKPFQCEHCSKPFSRSDALLRHRTSGTCLKKKQHI